MMRLHCCFWVRSGHGLVGPDVDARITTVENYLRYLNAGAGPGCTVLGRLVTDKMLVDIGVDLLKYAMIGVPLLLHFQRQLDNGAADGSGSA